MKKHIASTALGAAIVLSISTALALTAGDYVGKPAQFQAGAVDGAGVWSDKDGLHVRFTSKDKPKQFRGKVCTRSEVTGFKAHGLEAGDSARIGPKKHCVWFNVTTQGDVDGFDFKAPGQVVIFDIKLGRKALPPQQIWVGKRGLHPESSPFSLRR